MHIVWKDPELHRNIVILIGEFHELCVRIKTIYKRHALRGYQRWVIDAKTVSQGSSETSVEGRHHYTNMRNVFYPSAI